VAAATLALRGTPRVREAVRIRLDDGQGNVGLGEAMPLPGYSPDDAQTAAAVLGTLAERLAASGLPVPAGPARAQLEQALQPHDALLAASPSAAFALECALLDVLARHAGVTAATWLAAGRALQPVAVSLLLPDDDRGVIAAARAAVAAGFRTLKLKVARIDRPEREEDALLAALRQAVGPGVGLRLDANGALHPAAVAARLADWRGWGIELVEEPVAGTALLALPPLPLPWAADESLADDTLARALLALPPDRRPAALVLKPALLGLRRCLRLADQATAAGAGLIVTHSLDGELGLAAACALAAALPVAPWPCGLAPHAGLPRWRAARPVLQAPAAPGLGIDGEGKPA
jgi:L-alanine-DL-glutamate epimerase-like enolase superfamily enzyme